MCVCNNTILDVPKYGIFGSRTKTMRHYLSNLKIFIHIIKQMVFPQGFLPSCLRLSIWLWFFCYVSVLSWCCCLDPPLPFLANPAEFSASLWVPCSASYPSPILPASTSLLVSSVEDL